MSLVPWFVLLANFWIWRILFNSVPLGLLVLASSIFLYLSFKRNSKKYFFAFLVLFSLLLIFQWKTTSEESLVELSNDEQRVQQMRLKEYPPIRISIAHWFENREESIAFFRILENFSETIDPNLYFFANHPRERIGINEFEKFPYIFLPLFFYGLVLSVAERRKLVLGMSFILPVVLISIIGHKNQLGPFSLFPFLAVSITHGLELLFQTAICKKILKR